MKRPAIPLRQQLAKGLGLTAVVVLLALGLLAGMSDWLLTGESKLFPLQYVRVEGDIENLDPTRFVRAVTSGMSGGYFSLDIDQVERLARSLPWVERAQVERFWPDTLIIRITEHKPVARWGNTGLINGRGERFAESAPEQFAGLPAIDAPAGTEVEMLQVMGALNQRLSGKGLRVAALSLSKRHAWALTLSDGVQLFVGRQDPLVATDRFLELIPKLGEERSKRVARLDLRYPGGFSIVWKPDDGAAEVPVLGSGA
ncbi:MAG: FtsQ-type POTRA domain-containing protein [Methylococcaceae bacterium]|nr:FtsQ-type POTRA domain-containing protein [Methylococcaceae bacterium]